MQGSAADLATYGYALALAAHLTFALHLARMGYAQRVHGAAAQVFLAALVATAAWSLAALVEPHSRWVAPAFAAATFDLIRYALWFVFLLMLLRPAVALGSASRESRWLTPLATMAPASGANQRDSRDALPSAAAGRNNINRNTNHSA